MHLTLEQVTEMAPDSGSAAAGKKLMSPKNWEKVGRSPEAMWGLCRGSAVYQVKIDLSNFGYNCSCPSRKFLCKHVLGLLMMCAVSPDAVAPAEPPSWLTDWLTRRKEKEEKKAERQTEAVPKKPVNEKAQQRRAEQRESRVSEGLERLDTWLRDLVRNGLATVETKPQSFWDEQAKRLVDAQAPGLASRVARLGSLPRRTPDWPERLLSEIGRIKLLLHAWTRIDQLEAALQSEVRQLLGWNIQQEELVRDGEQVQDVWAVIGQWVDDEDRIRTQRSWLVGRQSGRLALVLQFAAGNQVFAEPIVPGSEQEATLVFYPGTSRQRAKIVSRTGSVMPVTSRLPGAASLDELFTGLAEQMTRQPWFTSFAAILKDVTLVSENDVWLVRDQRGEAIPLRGRNYWKMVAITAGQPFDLAGEWDGYSLKPMGLYVNDSYRAA